MKGKAHRILLRKLLMRPGGNRRLWPAVIALFMGTVLLLYAVILWTGFNDVLSGRYDKGDIDGTYLTISKPIPSSENITEQKQNFFSNKEIRAMSSLPVVEDIGFFTPGLFPVEVAFTGEASRFSTNLFLESVPERFIDDKPLDWYWQYSSGEVPVIVSNEFLNLYNFGYAPNQGVPQLTQGTIKALTFTLLVGNGLDAEEFTARVVGFSDRISSILVPHDFIAYGNERYAAGKTQQPSRIIIRVKDPSDELLVQYLKESKYLVNKEMLRFNRLRTVMQAATLGIGLLATILLAMGAIVFMLFAELTLARASHNLQLLLQIGYSPGFLGRFMYIRYVFILFTVMLAAGIAAIVLQVRTAKYILTMDLHIATFPSWQVWAALTVVLLALLLLVYRVVIRGLSLKAR